MMNTIRWNVAVSADTDQSLRMFLASQGGGRKGDLSRFIEEAVQAHILELTAEQVKSANANVNEADLTAMVDEAIQWARKR
ncbi:ribbon-helix-helix domain-containing protein [Sulfuriferula thiophila]|uniref:ribbon-helix-helix domain-containing protein n=1 Tax=Sulfuriferula thiophila TaxID=1781211 RepID=UPI003F98F3AD